MSFLTIVLVDGIDMDKGILIGILDILWYCKSKCEESVFYLIAAIENDIWMIRINKRCLGAISCCVVQATGNLFLCIAYHGSHGTIKRGVCLTMGVDDAPSYFYDRAGFYYLCFSIS